jgi:hypothetical protein
MAYRSFREVLAGSTPASIRRLLAGAFIAGPLEPTLAGRGLIEHAKLAYHF